jgi:hypothetical protein
MEPGVTYPLMATLCIVQELQQIDRVIIEAKCHALGINEHFPRAVLYGPAELGGMELKKSSSKNSSNQTKLLLVSHKTIHKSGTKT